MSRTDTLAWHEFRLAAIGTALSYLDPSEPLPAKPTKLPITVRFVSDQLAHARGWLNGADSPVVIAEWTDQVRFYEAAEAELLKIIDGQVVDDARWRAA